MDINLYRGESKEGSFHYTEDDQDEFSNDYPSINCYLKDHKAMASVEKAFGDEGIYLSKELASYFVKQMGIEEDDLNGMEIEYTVGVPIYNEYGRAYGADATSLTYITVIEYEQVRFPIAGILEDRSFGMFELYPYVIYMERGEVEKIIEECRKTKRQTVYVYNDQRSD